MAAGLRIAHRRTVTAPVVGEAATPLDDTGTFARFRRLGPEDGAVATLGAAPPQAGRDQRWV